MASIEKQGYRRIKGAQGRGRFLGFNRSRVWLAEDHLLLVELRVWSERYYRFYFKDIQAFTLRATHARAFTNLALAAGVLFFLWLAQAVHVEDWLVAWRGFAGILLVGMLVNSLQGRGCEVWIKTRVQDHELACVNRWPKAVKFIERLRPTMDAAQKNQLVLDESEEEDFYVTPVESLEKKQELSQIEPPSRAHYIHLMGWIFVASSEVLEMSVRALWTAAVSVPVNLLLVVTLVWAIILQRRKNFSKGLRVWTWTSLVGACLWVTASLVMSYRIILELGAGHISQLSLMRGMLLTPLDADPWLKSYYILNILLSGLLALGGIVVCLFTGRDKQ